MRVLIISPGGYKLGGGMGTVTNNIRQSLLTKEDFSVRVLDSRGEKGFVISFLYLAVSLFIALYEVLFSKEKMVIHINVSERASFYRKACFIAIGRIASIPCILHHHGAEFIQFYGSCSKLSKSIVKFCIKNADLNIVLGDKWKNFIELNFVDHSPVSVLFNAVPKQMVKKINSSLFTISMIANLSERKGVTVALDACKRLEGVFDYEINFVGGGEINKFQRMADDKGLSNRAKFHGWLGRDETANILANTDVMILPSYDEGLPMVILEAMAQEIPVVCSPVGSIGEVFVDKVHCLFCEVGSPESLAKQIKTVQSQFEVRETLVLNASHIYNEKFSIENYMSCLVKLYKSVF